MSDQNKPKWDDCHAMSPQPTFPSLEEFKHWYEQEFIAPKVVGAPMCGEGAQFRNALAQYYCQTENDHGLLACALNVWAKLQRDHEKVLRERCQEYERVIAHSSQDGKEQLECANDYAFKIAELTRENETLKLGATVQQQRIEVLESEKAAAANGFNADYTAACAKLDEQNKEINRLREKLELCSVVARQRMLKKFVGPKKLLAREPNAV